MSDNKFEVDQLKKAFGSFATGVCVATSHTSGFTVNSFASLSLNPPLMIFNIYKTETDYVEFLKKDKFAINFLSSDQKDISKLFASKETNKAENAAHHALAPGGGPVHRPAPGGLDGPPGRGDRTRDRRLVCSGFDRRLHPRRRSPGASGGAASPR